MSNKNYLFLILFFTLPLKAQINIDVDKAIQVNHFTKEDIFSDIRYLYINKEKNATDKLVQPYLIGDKRILLADWPSNLSLYNQEGEFIKTIPTGEQLITDIYDSKKDYFYIETQGAESAWYGIDLKIGEVVTSLSKPELYKQQIFNFKKLDKNRYGSFVNNQSGKDTVFFVFFDKEGNIKGTIPEKRIYKKVGEDTPYLGGQFYDYKGNHYFKEPLWGTIVYEIEDCKLIPHIIFNFGKKAADYYYRDAPAKNKGTYQLGKVIETPKRIYFSYNIIDSNTWYWGYYNKEEDKTYVTRLPLGIQITEKDESCNFIPAWNNSFETITAIPLNDKSFLIVIGELK